MLGTVTRDAAGALDAERAAGRLLGWMRRAGDEMVELLERLVAIETPSRDAAAQRRALELLAASLDAAGLTPRLYSGGASGGFLVARPPRRRGPAQMLLGHCDTVWPHGTLATMPWTVEGDVLRGPGVYDMKAGLVQGVFALRALAELGLEPAVAPYFLINSDEEIGSRGSRRGIDRLAARMDRVLVLEPSLGRDGKIKTARKGVGRFTVRVRGRAAHAGLDPERGASAILELSYTIQRLFALNDPERGTTVNVGEIDGGLSANVVAPESRAEVDVRVLTEADARRVEAAIHGLEAQTPGAELEISGGVERPPLERTPRNRGLWETARRLGEALGLELDEGVAGGGSDGNFTSLVTATLDGLGAVGDGAHAAHEHVLRSRMIERAAWLALIVLAPPLEPAAADAAAHSRRSR